MHRQRSIGVVLGLIVIALSVVPAANAYHFQAEGWRHKHYKYPPVPSGYSKIVSTFGQPCNSAVNDNRTNWVAVDNGKSYPVYYHVKLGGYSTHYGGTGRTDMSSNLNHDVRGHIRNDHMGGYVTHGIYGYACRKINNSNKWSTHAWGIAVDINSAANPYPTSNCRGMPAQLIRDWTDHGWKHGKSFSDCMHFQYAVNY
jgi:D-alanyl-D-alanine carboxypeptidase-like protein